MGQVKCMYVVPRVHGTTALFFPPQGVPGTDGQAGEKGARGEQVRPSAL